MFLHMSASHSVHRGGLPQCMLGYHHPSRSRPPLPRDQAHPQDEATPGADTPPGKTAAAADSTHPAGMHSCLNYKYVTYIVDFHLNRFSKMFQLLFKSICTV